ncbi:hypothetical protein FACS1894132_07990 [Clostridia bacterium]|nr:hypothetical protein FACS1894132_07990 [Clostridia bacterium]
MHKLLHKTLYIVFRKYSTIHKVKCTILLELHKTLKNKGENTMNELQSKIKEYREMERLAEEAQAMQYRRRA